MTSIGIWAFYCCHALTGVTIPDSVTTIEKNMFEECLNLTYVSIGNNVTSIEEEAFLNCPKLTSFTIPNRVTSIGDRAFKGCSSLSNIYFDGTETLWGQVNKGKGWKPAAAKEHWRCTVTFDANGHGTAPTAQTDLWSDESKATEPAAPTASGFVFTGWYTEAACTTRWNFGSDVVPNDMTLYAGWAVVLGSSYTLEVPEQVTIVPNTEWTTVTVDVTALQMQLMADGRTPLFLRLTFNYGTLKNKVDNSYTIPFKLATMDSDTEMEQSNQNVYEAGQKQFRIHIRSANWSAATPGTYSGTVSYSVRWRFDNNTWSGDLETGTIPVTVTIPEPLYDGSDNTASITAWAADGQPHNIVLQGRTLYKDGSWNTLCLPFTMTANQVAAQLNPTKLMTLSTSSFSGGTLTLNFEDATTIEAGKPYIVKWTAGGANIENPIFTGVTVSNATTPVVTACVDFIGITSPVTLTGGDRTKLYLGVANTLYYPSADLTINSCRAYFELKGGISAGDLPNNIQAFVLNFGGEETDIITIENERVKSENESWFSIDGRKLTYKPSAKGIYINNGKKVIIK